jgi:RND family efflux transporter MFP subunit
MQDVGSGLVGRVLRRALALGLMLGLAGGTASAQQGQQGQQAAMVQVDAVITEPLVQTVPVLGRIVTRQEGPVASRVEGPVAEIGVAVGDRLATGDLIAVLDRKRLQLDSALAAAELAATEADLAAARREVELLEQERDRLVALQGSAAFSRARLDDKIKEVHVAQSRIEAAAARLEQARVTLDYRNADLADAEIRAPYPSVVVQKHVSAGAHVRVGDPVVTLVDDSALEVEADVPAERLFELEPGTPIAFSIAGAGHAGGRHDAVLRAIVPMENPLTRTRAVRFTSVNGGLEAARAIGQSVTVDIPVGAPRDVVSVHKDAVTINLGTRQVYVVGDDDVVQPRAVVLGAAIGNRFEVLEGLAPGDLVVTRGNERLRPGQTVAYGSPGNGDAGKDQKG